MKYFFFAILSIIFGGASLGIAQTDSAYHVKFCGVVVSSIDSTPIAGCHISIGQKRSMAITDTSGLFCFPVYDSASHVLTVESYGYEKLHLNFHLVKDTFITIILTERPIGIDTVTVQAPKIVADTPKPLLIHTPPLCAQSVKISDSDFKHPLSIYEDPARVAQAYAGVYSSNALDNDLVVRGGSPNEVLWKLDGMDIPNPNHFARAGTTGGVLSAINPTLLSNSSFYTGALPPEFGSRLSAVYDLQTRDGNTESYHWTAQASFIGLEGSTDGPIDVNGSSFALAGRLSTLQVLQNTSLLSLSAIPSFEDLNAKLHFVLSSSNIINITSIWGTSNINLPQQNDQVSSGSGVEAFQARLLHTFSPEVSAEFAINKVDDSYRDAFDTIVSKQREGYLGMQTTITYIQDSNLKLNVGIQARDEQLPITTEALDSTVLTFAQNTAYFMGFAEWDWTPVKWFSLVSGLFNQYIFLSNQNSLEPRASATLRPDNNNNFWIGYGVQRQPELLQFVEADQFGGGYSYNPDPTTLLKVEGYQKNYYHAPVHAQPDAFSLLNGGLGTDEDYTGIVYSGQGRVTGAELTFKNSNDVSYILLTASYVHQQYLASDGIWRDGAFDCRFIVNLLSGFTTPFVNGTKLTLSENLVVSGGTPYTPIDLAASTATGTTVFDSTQTFGARNPPYIRLDVTADIATKWNRLSIDLYLTILNVLGINNIVDRYYDTFYNEVEYNYDLPFVPVLGIRVSY